jgi:hypothetical protein
MAGHGVSIVATKLAGLSLAAKVGVGVSVATAGVAGAGAAGVLPDTANGRARAAIEAVTPVDFAEPAVDHGQPTGAGDHRQSTATGRNGQSTDAGNHGQRAGDRGDNFGSVVSADATGESDGEPGVDGAEISSMAPGAAHRSTDPGRASAQAGPPAAAGRDRAGEPDGRSSNTPDSDTGAPAATPAGSR